MGRIHRYGQLKDCLIFNFVAVNTREGRVLDKLLHRLAEIKDSLGTDKVFDVIGEMLPSNLLERMFREMYARRLTPDSIEARIVRDVDPEKFKRIAGSTLEGLAKKELNLSALVGKSVEAKERRLVPEVVEDFFLSAGPVAGVHPTPVRGNAHVYRVGRVPNTLSAIGERQETKFGRLGREYQRVVFDKGLLGDDATLEWVTPGHPLFEAVRSDVHDRVAQDIRRGAIFWDFQTAVPYRLDVFSASIKDGRGDTLHRRLFVVRTEIGGAMSLRQPTLFLDVSPASNNASVPQVPDLPDREATEAFLIEHALIPCLKEIADERARQNETVRAHVEISLRELIDRQQLSLAELVNRRVAGENIPGLEGNIAQADAHLEELNARLERRRSELDMERHCTIGDVQHVGRSWVLPHPERATPGNAPMVRDEEIERIAVREAIAHEERLGWVVESVESENRGYDLLSKRPHPSEPGVYSAARFIEVKGRAGVGEVALSANEFRTAQRLGGDYWLYVVFDCGAAPKLNAIKNPATLGWEPIVRVEHYHVGASDILRHAERSDV